MPIQTTQYNLTRPAALSQLMRSGGRSCRLLTASIVVGMLSLMLHVGARTLHAQDDDSTAINREHRIKAAYLYQFGRYVDWPAKAFADSKAPFVIGVVMADRLAVHLGEIASQKKLEEHPIQVQRFSWPEEVRPCHILFLSAAVAPEAQAKIIRQTRQKAVLLVGDAEGFLDWGGTIRFIVEDNTIRLHIARKPAENEGLVIRSKLLQVARVVD